MVKKGRGKGGFSIIEWFRKRFRRRPKAKKAEKQRIEKPSPVKKEKMVTARMVKKVENPKAASKPPGEQGSGFTFKNSNIKDIFLETDVDRLLEELGKRGRVKASVLAGIFKVPRSKIEEWGIILEEHKLLEMHYPPFGEPTLMLRKQIIKKERKKK
jgi:hypothetical protein